jgi:hypothetical protein
MKNWKYITFIFFVTLVLAGCAHHYAPEEIGDPYGFFSGLWHGYIIIFSFLGWLFVNDVYIIGHPNTGLFYYFGFALGVIGFFGSSNR